MLFPGRQDSASKRNGPEPTTSLIRPSPAAATMRAGRMNGTGAFGFPSTCSISGNGRSRPMVNARALFAVKRAPADSSMRPSPSFGAQRCRDATQSAAVTAAPSWNSSPSRNVNRHVNPSGDASCASTIWGRIAPDPSIANSVSNTW